MKDIKIGVIGLGYVGLPMALLFSKKYKTIGFDINSTKVDQLTSGNCSNSDVDTSAISEAIANGQLTLTSDSSLLGECNFYVIAVPTPVGKDNHADLEPLRGASEEVGKWLCEGDIVVYESTVYPGLTEEFCVPILEKVSGMTFNEDFFVGYSPERINPSDKLHQVNNITKVTSGSNEATAETVDNVYNSVISAGTFRASSIKVAEASKIMENCERDVLIAFTNEMHVILRQLGIDSAEVRKAASTKWNFVCLQPGLVGGHCIAVDPYYLIDKAKEAGVNPQLLTAARNVNEHMAVDLANRTLMRISKRGTTLSDAKVLVLGFAFKPNCDDIRNTKVEILVNRLKDCIDTVDIFDPIINPAAAKHEYDITVNTDISAIEEGKYDAVVIGTQHECFRQLPLLSYVKEKGFIIDIND